MPITARAFVRSQLLSFAIGLVALVAVVCVAFWLAGRSSELSNDILAARDLKTAAVGLRGAVQRAESSQRGFLYTNNEVYLAPYDLAKADANRSLASLPSRLDSYPELAAASAKLVEVLGAKFAEMDQGIAYLRQSQPEAALDMVLTNRGKALMDEANVFITGIVLAADQRLSNVVAEQSANASWQRLVVAGGVLVAIAAAAAALITIFRYAAELSAARDALAGANVQLESKVAARTSDLAKSIDDLRAAKERAELLMHEVNHRVANSLAMVSSLVGLQANASAEEGTKEALAETQSRIQAIAMVHQRLYASGDVTDVALDDYLRTVLEQFQSTLGRDSQISLRYQLEQLRLKTDASLNLGVIASEWVMNAAKYAYPDGNGEVWVKLSREADGNAVLAVDDDGVGRVDGQIKGTGLGSRIVKAMARSLSGEVQYLDRSPGLSARLTFPLAHA